MEFLCLNFEKCGEILAILDILGFKVNKNYNPGWPGRKTPICKREQERRSLRDLVLESITTGYPNFINVVLSWNVEDWDQPKKAGIKNVTRQQKPDEIFF